MLYIMLVGYPPFYGESEIQIRREVQRGVIEFDGINNF